MGETSFQVIRILTLSATAFIVAMALTPLWTRFLYKYRLGKQIRIEGAPVFASMHKGKEGTPTMGGVLIWGTVLVLLAVLGIAHRIAPESVLAAFYFLSRAETLLPLAFLLFGALIGAADDILGILRIGPKGGGLSMRHHLLLYTFIAAVGAWWFFVKLDWDILAVPFLGTFTIGAWYIPIFIFILVATSFSLNLTDGLDGLSGGILLVAFSAFGLLSFLEGKMDLAAFCAAIVGALVAFLWFNVHPARFFMGDTGVLALGGALGVIAMLLNAALVLPLIAFIPVVESLSVILQLSSKRLRGKKIFLSAPIHHHFQALGWPETKVTERFWIIAGVVATLGIVIYLLGS
jgi:phospho-N-acetylmuramoyl-pentapeptide-transferase